MILGLLWMIVANAAAILGAKAVLGFLRTGRADVDFLVLLLLRIAAITVAILVAGVAGGLQNWILGLIGLAGLAALIAGKHHRGWPAPPVAGVCRPLLAIAAVLVARALLQVWIFAPHQGDTLSYHLPKVAEWVRAGTFTQEMGAHPHVTFPAGFELIETWWVVFLRHDVFIEMAGVEFLVLGAAAVIVLARQVGVGDRGAFLTALLFVLSPGFHLSSLSCLNDAPAAALTLAAFALGAARAHPALVLGTLALGIGVKPTVGFATPGVLLLMAIVRKAPSLPAPGRLWFAWMFGAGAAAAGAFWYARNLFWHGNPFYPMGEKNFEDPTYVQFGPRLASLPENLGELVNLRIYDAVMLVGPNVDHMAGWGAIAFACGLVALLEAMKEVPLVRRLAAGFGTSVAGILLLVQHDPWCLKYLFFVPGLLAVSAAWLAERRPAVRPVIWAAAGFSFVATCVSYDLQGSHLATLARQPWRIRSAAVFEHGQIGRGAPEDTVGYFGSPLGDTYLLYRPDFSRRVVYLRSSTAESLASDMDRENLMVLFAPSPTPRQQMVLRDAAGRGLVRVREGAWWERLR
jgi:hypothetical protein